MKDVDIIAETVPLTTELLIEEVFGEGRKTLRIKKKQRQLIRFINKCIHKVDFFCNDKPFVIYCMLSLWYEGKVENLNFKESWDAINIWHHNSYKRRYYNLIEDKQKKTIVV